MGVWQDRFSSTEVGVGVMVGVSCGGGVFVISVESVGAISNPGVFVYITKGGLSSTEVGMARHPERIPADKIIIVRQKSVG